jgi:hypothetical protein
LGDIRAGLGTSPTLPISEQAQATSVSKTYARRATKFLPLRPCSEATAFYGFKVKANHLPPDFNNFHERTGQ